MRLFFLSCSPFRLMYAQSRLVTSVRGTALSPITSLSAGLGVIGFMNAALGFLPDFFLAMQSPLATVSRRVLPREYHEIPSERAVEPHARPTGRGRAASPGGRTRP